MHYNLRTYRAQIIGWAVVFATVCSFFVSLNAEAQQNAASFFIGPATGSFTIGSTFTVSIFVNTGGSDVNAVDADLEFPNDKLQVISPAAGKSVVPIWIRQPIYDNTKGIIRFQGAIPSPGLNTSAGLISQVTFRVTGLGIAIIRFRDDSRVLLNDGKGTDILGQTTSGLYHLILPPPAGPLVVSPTHPNQEEWYSSKSATLEWQSNEPVQGYSYILSDQPLTIPDDIIDGQNTSQAYQNLADGAHYFHIKALRNGTWGGVTHFAVRTDITPPAQFPIAIAPSTRTITRQPSISFETTDALSGTDHYELRIISLDPAQAAKTGMGQNENFFIESTSPYVPSVLEPGDYDVVVRAYDKAGNYMQETERLQIVTHAFDIISDQGIRVRSNLIVSWKWIYGLVGILILLTGLMTGRFWHHHRTLHAQLESGALPEEVARQLEELKTLKNRYNQLGLLLIAVSIGIGFLFHIPVTRALSTIEPSPPVVDVVSRNISNRDIFYIGGATSVPSSTILIYLQNLQTGETLSETAIPNQNGRWFYSHPTFLSSGEYLLWAQQSIGETQSPPSPQINLTVTPTALQLGSSRLSYEIIYLGIAIILFLILLVFTALAVRYRRLSTQKREALKDELRRAEDSIRRGFALLHQDIQAEFKLIQQAKVGRNLSAEEQKTEERILKDLDLVKSYVRKEIWDVEKEL